MRLRVLSAALLLPLLVLLAGCGKNKSTASSLSGKVILNGEPVRGGTLHFFSDAGVYSAPIDPEGNYRLPDVPPGEMTVTVDNEALDPNKKQQVYTGASSGPPKGMVKGGGNPMASKYGATVGGAGGAPAHKGPGIKPAPPPEGVQVVKEGTYVPIPAPYRKKDTSPLKVKIEPGSNTKDFEMTGK